MSSEDKTPSKSWYAQHPLVSTFLWVLGNTSAEMSPELSSQHNSSSRLHWKDEFDGDICSAVVEDSDMINSPAKQSGAKGAMERQGSSTALKRSESGKMTTFNPESRIFQNTDRGYGSDSDSDVAESPQWGWYVSTTPPSREGKQVDPDTVHIVTNVRNSYYPPKAD